MTVDEIQQALSVVQAESDLNAKALLLAGLVSELFREQGFEPVVVGGSAIEFYTDGAYMSGDTDICWAGIRTPTMGQREAIMRHDSRHSISRRRQVLELCRAVDLRCSRFLDQGQANKT